MKAHLTRRIVAGASTYVGAIVVLGVVGGCSESVAPTPGPLGTIAVVTTTRGGDPDDDGYKIVIDGTRIVTVGIDRVAFLDSLSAGSHVVALEGVASNCDPVEPRSVDVAADDTSTVSFDVKCESTGVTITTQTVGPDYGPFQVKIGGRIGYVAANGILTLTRLTPGSQALSLVDLPSSCQIAAGQSTIIEVTNRKVAQVTIRLQCFASDKVIAFVLDDFRGGFIVVARVDGTKGDTLVKGHSPAWAPDGGKIMYSTAECLSFSYEGGDVRCFGGLFTLSPDSRVTNAVPGGQNGQDPAWSPDGKSIVFSRIDATFSDPSRLYVLRLDGLSSPVELNTPTSDAKHAAWSPDGKRIAFQCLVPGTEHNEICLINSDGTGYTQLTSDQGHNLRPAWSPDGRTIAFSTLRYSPKSYDEPDIAVMSADGSNIVRITAGSAPAWSPDGSKLLFSRLDGLFMSDLDGSGVVRITNGRHRYPVWRALVGDSGAGDWDY